MTAPDDTMVTLELDPAGFVLEFMPNAEAAGLAGAVMARADQRVAVRFAEAGPDQPSSTPRDPALPWGCLALTIDDPQLTFSDAVFLVSVLLLTDHYQDAHLHDPHLWAFVDARAAQRVEVAHPPRIETTQALLAALPVPTRIRLLVLACRLAAPVWERWAETGKLTYFDGIMSMAAVSEDMAQATTRAVEKWLDDGDPAPVQGWVGDYRGLHWPMLEDEWTVPQNVYYALFAPCNLATCALGGGDTADALVCMQQAVAARATDAQDTFLGEPYRRAFLMAWWRAALRVLCAG